VPRGAVNGAEAQRTLDEVRHVLSASGVRGPIQISSYPIADPRLASPLHLSYERLSAKVASRCGDWPDDLNSGATTHGWNNRSYYNLGCATTQTLAAQIDDPRDVLRPRAEDPSDVQLRTRAIGALRQGLDPATLWPAPTPISPVGGN
jgi:pilus assembly protein CpaD